MSSFRIPWAHRTYRYTEEEIAQVAAHMRAETPLTKGAEREAFESAFAAYHGVSAATTVSSATAALELTASCLRLQPGDEVVLPAHTWCATAIPFARAGARLRFADIEPDTRVISARTVEAVLTPKSRAVIAVHLYGLMADMAALRALCAARDLVLIEDCAQSLDASFHGHKAGSLGDFAVFSFHGHKSLNTLGEGGMFLAKDPEIQRRARSFAHKGVRPHGHWPDYWLPAMSEIDCDFAGLWPHNLPLTEAQCLLGALTLKRLPEMTALRQARASRFIEALAEWPELSFQRTPPGQTHAWHLLAARYTPRSPRSTRDTLIRRLSQHYRIQAIVQYQPLYRYPLFQHFGYSPAQCAATMPCPESDAFFDHMLSFPFHLWMTEADFAYMIDATQRALREESAL